MHELVTRAPIDRYLTLNITNFGTEKRCKEEVAMMTKFNCMKPKSWEEGLYTVEWRACKGVSQTHALWWVILCGTERKH